MMQAQPIPIGTTAAAAAAPTVGYAVNQASSPSRMGMVPSSFEQTLAMSMSLSMSPRSLGLISTSFEQRKLAFDRAFLLQEEMTRNYTCCGLTLLDLHALVDHFEEAHVVVVDGSSADGFGYGGGFELADDMELDDQSMPLPLQVPDATSVVLTPRPHGHGHGHFAPYPRHHPLTKLRQTYSDTSSIACASPTLLSSPSAPPSPMVSRPASPSQSQMDAFDQDHDDDADFVSSSTAHVLRRPVRQSVSMSAGDYGAGGEGQPRMKPFRCPKDGCNKSYKQANGLKYHLTHGQCNFAPVDPNSDDCKPYLCQVGCGKRFKNMSGLRYHYMHSAAHGQAGLALLEAGQMPVASQS